MVYASIKKSMVHGYERLWRKELKLDDARHRVESAWITDEKVLSFNSQKPNVLFGGRELEKKEKKFNFLKLSYLDNQ